MRTVSNPLGLLLIPLMFRIQLDGERGGLQVLGEVDNLLESRDTTRRIRLGRTTHMERITNRETIPEIEVLRLLNSEVVHLWRGIRHLLNGRDFLKNDILEMPILHTQLTHPLSTLHEHNIVSGKRGLE